MSTTFHEATVITYEIELTISGKKIGHNLLDDDDFKMTFIIDKIPNSPSGHQFLTQANNHMWIVYIDREEPITANGALDELYIYHTQPLKPKVNISL